MKNLVTGLALTLALFASPAFAQQHRCAGDATERAHKLLALHVGENDDRISIDENVEQKPSLRNPGGGGRLDVLEVWGYIYKARYRMRFLYFPIDGNCVLMGQEIIEYADPT